jgi:hypothetical protein
MKLKWTVTKSDAAKVQELLILQANNGLVLDRRRRNCSSKRKPVPDRSQFWRELVNMRLTSRNRSSPTGRVGQFAAQDPYPLEYTELLHQRDLASFIYATLEEFGGIRDWRIIARQLAANFQHLEDGVWDVTLTQCSRLDRNVSREVEAEVANYIMGEFAGFGPKQSRNLLQSLGLTRYEVPIDSRVINWLNEFGFPIILSPSPLSDINYYSFVLDGLQELSESVGEFPCVIDAAIFSLPDGEQWDDYFASI